MYSSLQGCHTATGTHMPYGITQCYLPPGRGDIPALTSAKAGTRLSHPGGMQCWVDLVGLLHTEMVYTPPPKTVTRPGTNWARHALTLFMWRTLLTSTPRRHDARLYRRWRASCSRSMKHLVNRSHHWRTNCRWKNDVGMTRKSKSANRNRLRSHLH